MAPSDLQEAEQVPGGTARLLLTPEACDMLNSTGIGLYSGATSRSQATSRTSQKTIEESRVMARALHSENLSQKTKSKTKEKKETKKERYTPVFRHSCLG